MTLNRAIKLQTNKTYGNWDFTLDGAADEPRVKGKDKHLRSKYSRTIEKRLTKEDTRIWVHR